jgi:nucleoside-diphosphate-sugar epimerase
MNVLITGGARFVVRWFTTRLLEEGNKVTIIDSLVEGDFGVLTQLSMYGLKKNTAQLFTLFGLSNLWMVRGKLMKAGA